MSTKHPSFSLIAPKAFQAYEKACGRRPTNKDLAAWLWVNYLELIEMANKELKPSWAINGLMLRCLLAVNQGDITDPCWCQEGLEKGESGHTDDCADIRDLMSTEGLPAKKILDHIDWEAVGLFIPQTEDV